MREVNITNCTFVNNIDYRGHGAAIYYSSNDTTNSTQSLFRINDCNFTHNYFAKSIVYIESRISKKNDKLIIDNSNFLKNKGISIQVAYQNLTLNGKVVFWNNRAEDGAGIYMSNYSIVKFSKNSNTSFIQNVADNRGAAIYLNNYSRKCYSNFQ